MCLCLCDTQMCIRTVYVRGALATEGIIVTWVARVYAADTEHKNQKEPVDMPADKRDAKSARYLSNGMACGVRAVGIALEQGQGI